ncbi:hypothetical protein HMPREF1581_01539 [Gardnerella vaginalis JCP8108]|uniref:Uncharacterized protein n=1 Tax=Gardnerella vaginalis JCP8108 TaxID=1261066 RepID=S4HXA6_GARVA|nr:hypothetical protein HMPREF1581_01539 [Gardnerella vaginalis JCP8108]
MRPWLIWLLLFLFPVFVSFCPCLFPFWVEWETKAGTIARICLCIGLSGKRKRERLPEFVPILFVLVNKSGDDCLSLFTFWVVLGTNAGAAKT